MSLTKRFPEKKRSCETQLIEFVHGIAFNIQKGIQNDVVVMEFAKTLDKVAHNRLLYKWLAYGVKGNTLGWIGFFLSLEDLRKLSLKANHLFLLQFFQASHRAQS